MTWRLRDGARELELFYHRDPLLRFQNDDQATTYLRRFQPDPRAMRTLRAALQEAAPGPGSESDENVLRRMGALLASGTMRLGPASAAETVAENGHASGDIWPLAPLFPVRWADPVTKVIVKKPPPQQGKKKDEKTWIEIQLLDEGGSPIPDAKYEIEFADGKTKKGKLDKKGKARVENLDPEVGSSAVVRFPEMNIELNKAE